LTLRGTPTLYYGDEPGIGHVEIVPTRITDPWAKREPGLGIGRDPSRTPVQWDASPFAVFSHHEPLLPLTPDYEMRNVAAMSSDETSILSLIRTVLHYRRNHTSLSQGEWHLLARDSSILAYERRDGKQSNIRRAQLYR
jgi:alpha-glucosidase